MKKTMMVLVSTLLLISGCSGATPTPGPDESDVASSVSTGSTTSDLSTVSQEVVYRKISATQAKEMIDGVEPVVILDVRTQAEYDEGHIKDSILLPYDQIPDKATSVLPDKNATILVYCRSGNRSATASNALIELGYTNVLDFGGIIDWPYDIEK
jgi:phage shock protein E